MRDRASEAGDGCPGSRDVTDFDRAVEVVLQHEGGLVDDPDDPGGITNHGISLRFLRRVRPGARLGEASRLGEAFGGARAGGARVGPEDVRNLTRSEAIELYRRHFWHRYGYASLWDQRVATKVFDLSVNMGPRGAHVCLQRALRAAEEPVVEDGVLGPKTLAAVHRAQSDVLLAALRSEAAGWYRNLASPKHGYAKASRRRPKYITGWLKRAYS